MLRDSLRCLNLYGLDFYGFLDDETCGMPYSIDSRLFNKAFLEINCHLCFYTRNRVKEEFIVVLVMTSEIPLQKKIF